MVLSLVDLSLRSIANGIKDGTIQHPHLLPPKLRQRVLDTVLERGSINHPKSMALLSSAEFLNGMESFGIENGNFGLKFLNRLEKSMATRLPNGETIGDGITKLNLIVYGCDANVTLDNGRRRRSSMKASSFPLVSQLIVQCPNTTSLALRGIMSDRVLHRDLLVRSYSDWFPSVLNENNACAAVMENLVNLSLRDMKKVISSDRPIINFKRLTTLKLNNCLLEVDIWPEFLRNVPTLENLQVIGVKGVGEDDNDESHHPGANGLDRILPISMPHLKSLEIIRMEMGHLSFVCNKTFVDNLVECPEIRQVHLSLDQESIDEESMERLANMNIDLKVKARVVLRENEEVRAALDSTSKFKLVRIFHGMMESLELCTAVMKWSPELSTAFEDVFDSCSKLTSLLLRNPDIDIEPAEMKRVNAAMIQLFGNRERAMQLKDLRLVKNFDEAVILAVFENCLNLDRLEIWSCEAVRDRHLIDWVSNGGGKLKYLALQYYSNVTSQGIIPILAKSGERLLRIHQYPATERNWKTVYKNLCPRAKY